MWFVFYLYKVLHEQFELPDDQPFFRRANAYHFPNEPYKDGYLRNPHLVLTNPSLDDGKVKQNSSPTLCFSFKHRYWNFLCMALNPFV